MKRQRFTPLVNPDEHSDNSGTGHATATSDSTGAAGSIGGHGVGDASGGVDRGSANAENDDGNDDEQSRLSTNDSEHRAGHSSESLFGNFTIEGREGGGNSGNGSDRIDTGHATNNAEPITSESGRHKRKQCGCQKCADWRVANGVDIQVVDPSTPSTISFDTLSGRTSRMAKNITTETLKIGLSALYELPTLMLPEGTADHWPLTVREEKTLSERIEGVLDMLPKNVKKRGTNAAAKILPPLALFVTAIMITKPRIDMTREAMQRRARVHPPQPIRSNVSTPTSDEPRSNPIVGSIRPDTTTNESAGDGRVESTPQSDHESVASSVGGNGYTGGGAFNNPALSDPTF